MYQDKRKLLPEVKFLKIDSISDFDSIKHKYYYIEFPPGGKVGDREWQLQFMHNSSVALDYAENKKSFENPSVLPAHYFLLPVNFEMENIANYSIDSYIIAKDSADIVIHSSDSNILFASVQLCFALIYKEMLDILPLDDIGEKFIPVWNYHPELKYYLKNSLKKIPIQILKLENWPPKEFETLLHEN